MPLIDGYSTAGQQSGPPQIPKNEILFEITEGNTGFGPNTFGASGPNVRWNPIHADSKGHFSGPNVDNGWITFTVNEPADTTVLLDAQGDSYALVNGEPEVGDVYEKGYAKLPIHLQKGDNYFLFRCVRGDFSAQLLPVDKPIALDLADTTLPDLRPQQIGRTWGSLLLRNATDDSLKNLSIRTIQSGRTTVTPIHAILPLSLGKVGFQFLAERGPKLHLELMNGKKVIDTQDIQLRERKAGETYKETFLSDIDGSVQYFAVNPAWNLSHAGLALSLHGAGVEAIGQADAYSSKPWCNIVCPTNRRPFGFDWEDWGRLDALEVLGIAEKELQPDPSRIYLVGHSMGGHGTILNGALYPGKFAAIAPSAGWISASTYAGRHSEEKPDTWESILNLASYQDETRRYLSNYKSTGIYLLQGGADDNVPPTEAKTLAALLGTFHHDFIFNLVPGQGHWWDINPEPGADCLDLAALWDFLAKHAIPPTDSVHDIDYSTSNPEVSSHEYWATVEQQQAPMRLSRVQLHADPFLRKISGNTRNVRLLKLDLSALHPGLGLEIDLDGETLKLPTGLSVQSVLLNRRNDKWTLATPGVVPAKGPERNGPFRLAFQHNFLFVYGTHGTAEENRLLRAKVRYDAETWWYRANGSVDIVADTDYQPNQARGRNVILYGNEDTNSAWKQVLPNCPLNVKEGLAKVFSANSPNKDVTSLYWWPREGTKDLSVGVIGVTGPKAIQASFFLPYLQPMIGYPDWLWFTSSALNPQLLHTGILDTGFYGNTFQFLYPETDSWLPATRLDSVQDLSPAPPEKPIQN